MGTFASFFRISINIYPPTKFVEQITGETDGETRYKDLDQVFWIAKTPGPNTYSTLNEMFTVHLGAYIKYSGPFMLVGWLYFYLYCMSCSYICLCIWVDVWVSKVNILQKAIRIPLVWGQMPAMTWHDPPYWRHTITMLFNTPWQDPSLVLHSYIPLDMTWTPLIGVTQFSLQNITHKVWFFAVSFPDLLECQSGNLTRFIAIH